MEKSTTGTTIASASIKTKKSKTSDLSSVVDEDDFQIPTRNEIFLSPKNKIACYVVFHDGYTIRQFFEFCKSTTKSIPLIFTNGGIYISTGNDSDTKKASFIIRAFIDETELKDYMVDPNLLNANGQLVLNINQKELQDELKCATKNTGVILCKYVNHPDLIIYLDGDKCPEGGSRIKIETHEHKIHSLEDDYPDAEPDYKIPLSLLSPASEKASKFVFSSFKCYQDEIRLTSNNIAFESEGKKFAKWDSPKNKINLNVEKGKCLITNIEKESLKKFKQLSALFPKGIIKFFCKKDGILKLQLKLATTLIEIFIIDETYINLDK